MYINHINQSRSPRFYFRNIKFTVNVREGGMMLLPDGASREDLLSTTRIRDYVQKHALKWYQFVKKCAGDYPIHPNGTLYVVTGADKALRWANCVTHTRKAALHRLWKPSEITYHGATEDSVHYWDSDPEVIHRFVFERSRPVEHVGKCALLIRGIRFAVSVRDWTEHVLYHIPPDIVPFNVIRTVPNTGLRAQIQTLKECRSGYTQMTPGDDGIGILVSLPHSANRID